MNILTKYENNNGSTENCLNQSQEVLDQRTVDLVDIALDQCAPHHYKEEEDLLKFQSLKTSRGPLCEGWMEDTQPIMCSYKLVDVRFELMSLLQNRVEEFVHKVTHSSRTSDTLHYFLPGYQRDPPGGTQTSLRLDR